MTGTDAVPDQQAISPYPIALSWWSGYLLAILLLAIAFALRMALLPAQSGFPFSMLFPGIAILALVAGLGPTLFYTLAGPTLTLVMHHPTYPGFEQVRAIAVAGFVASGLVTLLTVRYYQRWVVSENSRLRASMRQLAVAEQQLRRSFDETPLGIAHVGLDGRWLRCNPRLCAMLGYTEIEMRALDYREITHPDDLMQTDLRRAKLARGEVDAYQIEKRYRRRDGSWLWAAVTLSLARKADGSPDYTLSTVENVDARHKAQEALRISEARFKAFMDSAPAIAWLLDDRGRYLYMNEAWERAMGRPREACLGQSLQELLPADRRDGRCQDLDTLAADGPLEQIESFGGAPQSPRLWRMVRFPVAAGNDRMMIGGMGVEVTSQIHAEAALRESETRTQAIVGNASDAIVSTDGAGRVTLFNPAAERLFGVCAQDMYGQPLDRLLPAEGRVAHASQMSAFATSGVSQRAMNAGRVAGVHADGTRIDLEASISQTTVAGKVVLTAMLRDITERTRAERRLVAYQLELSGLNRRLLAQEKETTHRLAQSLHDELGQTLAALRMQFDANRVQVPQTPPRLMAGIERMDSLIAQANQQVREVLADLRPPLLDEMGLVAALENELQRQTATGVPPLMSLIVDDTLRVRRWPADVEFSVFMVAREALYNALRHAEAEHVEVIIEGGPALLEVWVEDDGVGLPDESRRSRPGHLGLVGMRERASTIGATLKFGSAESTAQAAEDAPDRGTRVHLRWSARQNPQGRRT